MIERLEASPTWCAWDVVCMDAVTFLREIPDASVDLVITDPPYESLEKWRAKGTTTRLKHSKASSNDWFETFPNARFPELLGELKRVLKRNRHCYIFVDQETMFALRPAAEAAGFKWWKGIVWDKLHQGMGYHYRARFEHIAFLEVGKRKLANLGIPDVLAYKRIWRGFPAEKPVPLMEVLVSQSSEPGEVVVDPFVGSGASGQAAVRLGRRFLGCDLNPAMVQESMSRICGVPEGPI